MSAKSLYEEDFHAWALEQARVLRELGQRVALPNDLDLQHVAEEVEDLGNEQRYQVESNLTQALIHLMKAAAMPDSQAVGHWAKETAAFLRNARKRYRPSMRRLIDSQALWSDSLEAVRIDLAIDTLPMPPFPGQMPFQLDELLAPGIDPRALAADLAALIASPPA